MDDFFNKYPLLKHLGLIVVFLMGIVFMTLLWLRFYTNHGEKIKLPNLVGMGVYKAADLSEENDFALIVTDSVFKLGTVGGTVLSQNPKAGAEVKSGRKIYVTIAKFTPDKIKVGDLPVLYGNDFNQKITELGYRGLRGKVIGRKYDAGEPNHILEVFYKGKLIINQDLVLDNVEISKGDELEFVVSDRGSGEITIPNLICLDLAGCEFLLISSKLELGEVQQRGTITDKFTAYVVDQEPKYDGVSKIPMGSRINVIISQSQPSDCN
jgi:beta-lactam-binding protein with PASTA domain